MCTLYNIIAVDYSFPPSRNFLRLLARTKFLTLIVEWDQSQKKIPHLKTQKVSDAVLSLKLHNLLLATFNFILFFGPRLYVQWMKLTFFFLVGKIVCFILSRLRRMGKNEGERRTFYHLIIINSLYPPPPMSPPQHLLGIMKS